MPVYKIRGPDGKLYKYNVDSKDANPDDVLKSFNQQFSIRAMMGETPKEEAGFFGSFKEAVSQLGLTDEAAAYANNPTKENRNAFLKAAESKYKSVGGFGRGRNWEAFKEMLGSSLGALVAPVGAAIAAAPTGPIGAGAAFGGASAAQYEIANLQRQAEAQKAAEEEGKPVPELNLGRATAAAFGQAALDVIPGAYVAKSLRAFPIAQRMLGSPKTAEEATDILIDAYKKGNITRKGEVLKGIGHGVAFEVPQEIAQQALERWQAGLSLTDDDAREEFKQAAIGAAVLAPIFGGAAGLGEYKSKVQEIGQQYARDAEMLFGGQAPEQAGFSPEMYEAAARADRAAAEAAQRPEPPTAPFPAAPATEPAVTDEDVDAQIEARRQARLDRIAEGDREAQQLGLVEEPYQPFKQERTPEYERDAQLGRMARLRRLRQARPDLDDNTIDYLMAEGYSDKQIAEYEPAQREEGLADVYSDEEIAGTGLPSTQPEPVRPAVTAAEETVTAPSKVEETVSAPKTAQYGQEAAAVTPTGEKGGTEQLTTPAATSVAETDRGPIGGGADLFTQRPAADERGAVGVEPTGVDQSGVPSTDVVEGESKQPSPLDAVEEWLAKNKKKRKPEDTALYQQALDLIRATGKGSALVLQNKLGITMSKAKALREALLGSGAIVQKTNVKGAKEAGNYFVVEGTYKPSEPVRRVEETKEETSAKPAPLIQKEEELTEGEKSRREMDDAEEKVTKNLPPTLRPEIGQGEYGLTFTNKDGNIEHRAYPTAAERNNARVELSADGARGFSTFSREAELLKHETNFINGMVEPGLPKTKTKTVGGKKVTYMSDQLRAAIEGVKNARSRIREQLGLFAEKETPTPEAKSISVNRTDISKLLVKLVGRLREAGRLTKRYRDQFRGIVSDLEREDVAPEDLLDNYRYLQGVEANLDRAEGQVGEAKQAWFDEDITGEDGEDDIKLANRILDKIDGEEEYLRPEKEGRRTPLDFGEQILYFRPGRALNRFKRRKTRTKGLKVSDAEVVVESLIKNWRNPPKIVVVQNYRELPMERGVDPDSYSDAVGMTSGDTVYLVADNIRSMGELKAVLYHESLGHYGLGQLFRDQLTDVMRDIYRTNPKVRAAADAWLDANPDAYPEDQYSQQEREALAVEELLAEHAEDGPMRDPSWRRAFYRVASLIRKFGRALARMVGKDFAYSNSEVADIIIQAHDKVLTGRVNLIPRYNNVRFMRAEYDKRLSNVLDFIGKKVPAPTQSILKGNVDALSKLPVGMQAFRLKTLSMHHMVEMFEKYVPGIARLEMLFERMASSDTMMQVEFEKDYAKYRKVLRDNQRYEEEFNNVAEEINLTQVPVFQWNTSTNKFERNPAARAMLSIPTNSAQYAALNPTQRKLHEVVNRFEVLPADMQQTMLDIYSDYRNYSDQTFAIKFKELLSKLSPAVAQSIQNKFQTNRLQFYLPLRREQGGEYKLRWIDAQGRQISKLYGSEAARIFAEKEATAAGGTNFEQSMVDSPRGTQKRIPTGLLKELTDAVEQSLRASGASSSDIDATVALIFDTFVDFMPGAAGSNLRQEIGSRVQYVHNGVTYYGRLGANPDVLGVYASTVPTMVHQLNSLKYVMRLENMRARINEELAKYSADKPTNPRNAGRTPNPQFVGLPDIPDDVLKEIKDNLDARIDFAKNPYYSPYVYNISKANYLFSIALNVSSALINTTIIPMMAWPTLAAKYGVVDATVAISQATKLYFKSAYTDPQTGKLKFNMNPTFGAGPLSRELELFHRTLESRGVVGTAAEQELRQAEAIKIKGYEGLSAKVDLMMSYVFRTSERYNREVSALATYLLARNINPDGTQRTAGRGQASVRKAIEEAIRLNKDINGASLKETNNSLYQTDIGRIVLTFRTHGLNMIINLAMTMRNAIRAVEPDLQKRKLLTSMARRKLLGIFAATYMFSGIKGLPFFGAAEVLASWLMGDDDEPYDLEQEVLDALGTLGLNGPVNELFNIDVASRTGFNGLLWRDDPKRLAEVGAPLYVMERIAGPTYGLVERARRGFNDFSEGYFVRGLEEFTPAPIRNMIKGTRYAVDGALTKDGLPLVDDVNAYNSVMQILGFSPADLAVAQSQLGASYQVGEKLKNRRVALLTKIYAARSADNPEAMQDAIDSIAKFNDANPQYAITGDSVGRSFRERERRAREAIHGVRQPRDLRMATSKYVADLDEEDED